MGPGKIKGPKQGQSEIFGEDIGRGRVFLSLRLQTGGTCKPGVAGDFHVEGVCQKEKTTQKETRGEGRGWEREEREETEERREERGERECTCDVIGGP